MNFKYILKDLRQEYALSQKDVAEGCKLSPQCISQLEAGTRNPTGSTLLALAQYFKVSVDYLLGLENEQGAKKYTATPQFTQAYFLDETEKSFLDMYKNLPKDLQHRAFAYLQKLSDINQEETESIAIRRKNAT